MSTAGAAASSPCPRCGRPVAGAFDASGVCVLCAGELIFAQTMAARPGSTPPIPTDESFAGPAHIGPYAIISELGRGGMGAVYLAQHAELGRVVALKVIPVAGSATSDLEMRFLREARTIARLAHPHIVTVYDAGRDRGHAYFAMDYLEDGDLARRLRAQPFTPREAATLMREVAGAIAYSHGAGVIHRDLKPSNILLAAGTPLVADFGLAAELDSGSGLTARTAILGTPHYLAPEALKDGSAATGVASDVYSLGVILFEMLTGRTPFAGASPAELPGLLAAGEVPALALLAPAVPRDLATICTKCLEFEPIRRYATAAALGEDLRRFLAGEPILARPVSRASQLLRWARRRPALAATWVLSMLLAGASLTAAVLVNRERLRANQETANSAAFADYLRQDILASASAGRAPDVRLRTVIDASLENIPRRFATAPLGEAELRLALAGTYDTLGEFERAEQQYRRAVALRRFHLGPNDLATLESTVALANCLNHLGHPQQAAELIRPATAALTQLFGQTHPATIDAITAEADTEFQLGQLARAERLAGAAVGLARRQRQPDLELTSNALAIHAKILASQRRYDEAAALCRETVAISERVLGPAHFHTLSMRLDLAAAESLLGPAEGALVSLRQLHNELCGLVGPDHPESLRALGLIGTALSQLGKPAEAGAVYAELVAARRRLRGPEHSLTLAARKLLALTQGRIGQLDQAIAEMSDVAAVSARVLGPDHLKTIDYLGTLAGMLLSARRYDDALVAAQAAYRGSLQAFGPNDDSTLTREEMLANALDWKDRFDDSEPHWRHVAERLQQSQPEDTRTYLANGQLGKALFRLARPAEAEPRLRESYAALVPRLTQLSPLRRKQVASLAETLAFICLASGREAEAAEWRAKAATS